MRSILLVLSGLLFIGCASSEAGDAVPGSIRVEGDVAHPRAWTGVEIAAEMPEALRVIEHQAKDRTYRLRALPLSRLIRAAEPRIDSSRKNHALAFAVAVSARDGYTVVFDYDEVVPFKDAKDRVFLAIAEEAGPLPGNLGPARLVVEGEGGDARKMHSVDRIRVLDLADPRRPDPKP